MNDERSSSVGGPLLCPSAPCAAGNDLIGIVGRDGRVGLLAQPIRLDANFVSMAREGRDPARRFRFATPCLAKGCTQWNQDRCGVSDEVIATLGAEIGAAELQPCGIRGQCRWFRQAGAGACAACPDVLREMV
jgi:hypothetical protein